MKALLIQPPIYDTQYYAEWSMPSGLLKVATWLRKDLGYDLRLIDCLYPDAHGKLKQRIMGVVQVCSTLKWTLSEYRELSKQRFGRTSILLPPSHRYKYEFGRPLAEVRDHLTRQLPLLEEPWAPDEIWVTSIMTYWWESTLDTLLLAKELYPNAKVRVGGIYPTLAPNHLRDALRARGYEFQVVRGRDLEVTRGDDGTQVANPDCIVTGEVPEASNADLDFEVFRHMTREFERQERLPEYAILMTSRGCPFDCSYCAQKAYNEGNLKVRIRSAKDTLEEIRTKYHEYGIRRFAFYEDNFLLEKANIQRLLELLLEHKDELQHLRLYAPEGIEVRLLHDDLAFAKLMKETGFESVYLPLENMSREVTNSWNRRHSHAGLFEGAVKVCHDAQFQLHNMAVNAFILFGMPGEDLQDIVNTIFYASEKVGGIVPMLFTPVPGSLMYEQYEEYLHGEMGFDLHHLNGKLYPFLRYNAECRGIRLEDYVALESLAFRLNARTFSSTFQLTGKNAVYASLRNAVADRQGVECPPLLESEAAAS